MHTNADLVARKAAATPRGVAVMGNFFVERAEGALLFDVEGRRYIDFAGGIAVMNVGHGHPKVVAAVQAQMAKFSHTCWQVAPYEGYVALAEKLNALTPGSHAKKTAFFSTGAEAVENTIKIARAHTRRSGVIAFGGAFHGRSLFAVSLTGKVQPYKAGFGPFAPEVYHAPFPCHCASLDEVKKAVQHIFRTEIEPARVAAIIFEPVQGEGGFNPIQPAAVRWLRELCDEHGIVLIADEIQTGFGRSGTLFAMERYFEQTGVVPDLMTIAKSLGAGLPLSAVTGRAEIMDAASPGGLGGTYAGNPVAIAAAHAVIDIMRDEGLPARGERLGQQLKAVLDGLRQAVPEISDVRGPGAMVAAELRDPRTGAPLADMVKRVQAAALARGLVLLSCGVDGNVLRFLFPLTIDDSLFTEALAILQDALREARG
ncbi:4-aminobutyrate--2-oxoglutarate transaminase [Pseudaquabacterium pictum]|uniref:4-aminobutyrate transaminase n=1 Tax=Pseudaquabacterium pictum TaxID=2315236 RepID=A0A480ASB7_9BURK|nr:4-aminobutyrate--2-oxoglutarate transaminase [Rubrivivax pictus]GCL61658.1 4-aminobutyrate transaminase [Rubrivivax pictus]